MEILKLGYLEQPRHSLARFGEGVQVEQYDISGWNSADWRKYHAFIRSLRNTKFCRGFYEKS